MNQDIDEMQNFTIIETQIVIYWIANIVPC